MFKSRSSHFCVLILALISIVNAIEEPAFPTISKELQLGKGSIHILAESVDNEAGYESIEELADLKDGRYARVQSSKTGHSVTFSDSKANLVFHYQPYSCEVVSFADVDESMYKGLMNAKAEVNSDKDVRIVHLYGLTALWLNVANMNKTYSTARLTNSVSNNIVINAHKWTALHDLSQTLVHMYFIENKPISGLSRLALELVQLESIAEKKITTTLNILTLEYEIAYELDEKLLKVPVGYGCFDTKSTANARLEFPSLEDLYMGPLLAKSHRIELEATGTSYTAANGKASDTISYELARTQSNIVGTVQLLRQRDTKQDIKTILNYNANVQFKIDMRSGSCTFTNIGAGKERGEKASLKFSNGLELDMDSHLMQIIFVDNNDFFFVKRSNQGTKNMMYLYFEREVSDLIGEGTSRIVRTYSYDLSNRLSEIKLDSVTIWTFNGREDTILQSFHLNVIEATEISSINEIAKVFDISEECYLNNDKMKSGRDYVWIQLTYPLDTRYSKTLAAHTIELKETILYQFSNEISESSVFLVPRLEFLFEETSFILRILMIDIPPLEIMYDQFDDSWLVTSGASMEADVLSEDVAVDVKHCADICRLSSCIAMTFCDNTHKCLTSARHPDDIDSPIKIDKNYDCSTFAKPRDPIRSPKMDSLLKLRLHLVISNFQHQNYGDLALPKMPDELALPQSETGVSNTKRHDILLDYLKEVYLALEAGGQQLPSLTFHLQLNDALVMLIPSKFELEQDPLSEFSLSDISPEDEQDASDIAPPFREGLSMHRYKINTFVASNRKDARLLSGVTYDQCSLACLDGKCSSFSYCSHRQECIVTNIYTIGAAASDSLIEQDADCFISQRDFLSKFNKFQDVGRPEIFKNEISALNPSECAHSCVVEITFRCLAFDFCQPQSINGHESQLSTCFLLEERSIFTADLNVKLKGENSSEISSVVTHVGCNHYSRSYLSDFNRIEYRRIEPIQLGLLKTDIVEGHSVDKCADICVNQMTDCTAFEFCFDPDSKRNSQRCTMIESRPQNSTDNYETDFNGLKKEAEETVTTSKFFKPDQNCHVFAMRRDSSEARLRDLAFTEKMDEDQVGKDLTSSGLSLGGGIMLYVCLTSLFTVIGCMAVFAKNQNQYLRAKIERLELIMGIWKR